MQYKLNEKGLIEIDDAENFFSSLCEHIDDIRSGEWPFKGLITTGEAWFRGESCDFETKLLPKLFREPFCDETDLLIQFKNRFPQYESQCTSNMDWLNLMQHYGVPTRLLDWTKNALVALYFAVVKDPDKDGMLYVHSLRDRIADEGSPLTPAPIRTKVKQYEDFFNRLIELNHLSEIKEFLSKYNSRIKVKDVNNKLQLICKVGERNLPAGYVIPIIIEYFPKVFHARISSQQGCFTCHFGKFLNKRNVFEDASLRETNGVLSSICHIKIPKKLKSKLKKQLETLGVSRMQLFPEPESFFDSYRGV
jgi:hypothetical protein